MVAYRFAWLWEHFKASGLANLTRTHNSSYQSPRPLFVNIMRLCLEPKFCRSNATAIHCTAIQAIVPDTRLADSADSKWRGRHIRRAFSSCLVIRQSFGFASGFSSRHPRWTEPTQFGRIHRSVLWNVACRRNRDSGVDTKQPSADTTAIQPGPS